MDKKDLLNELIESHKKEHKKSELFFRKAIQYQIEGGSHNLRLFEPFPFYDVSCKGSQVKDMDGNTHIDFWQGHFANILGHNPKAVIDALMTYFQNGQGLTTGFPSSYQSELAELILGVIYADKIRFTTSGTLAAMYAIMLSKSYTQRDLVMKIGGGWHGSQPYSLKGISTYDKGLNQIESAGLPPQIDSMIVITKFNDNDDLEDKFKEHGDRVACLIIEPLVGAGGFIFASKEYLQLARELTDQFGALLIFDEVVTGFRFHAGGLQTLYTIRPDLTVLGKAIGGGMPVSAVAGREDVMKLCGQDAQHDRKVKFDGGTFSSHPAGMLAGIAFIKYLMEHQEEIYPKIGRHGDQVRKGIEKIFSTYGFNVKCTGWGSDLTPNSSLVGVHFLHENVDQISSPDQVWNPDVCDSEIREKIFKLAMLEQGFNTYHGYGAISAAHSDQEIQASLGAVESIAKRWKEFDFKFS